MNASLLSHEFLVVALGLVVLLADLWLPASVRPKLGYLAAGGLAFVLLQSVRVSVVSGQAGFAFGQMTSWMGWRSF
jgi:hypothetical protein